MQPLRDEVASVTHAEGWTKAAMGKCWKLDSFLRESLRHNPTNPCTFYMRRFAILLLTMPNTTVTVRRKALKSFSFSDGTYIPKGTVIVTPPYATHFDDAFYANPETFDPLRFYRERQGEGEGAKYQFTNTSTNYIPFGHGKHAW